MRKFINILGLLFAVVLSSQANAESKYGDYVSQYDLKANRDDHKMVHGYYPYYFSDQARSRYSYSEREKGAYIFGNLDKPWPFPKKAYKLDAISVKESEGILFSTVSQEHRRKLDEKLVFLREEARKKAVTPQVNDTRDIERKIEQHRWTWESTALKEAYLKNSDHIKTDLTDYETLFQQK